MAFRLQRSLSALSERPLSADFTSCQGKDTSILYSLLPLPAVVKCRLPRLPSIRRSVVVYGTTKPTKASDSRPSTSSSTVSDSSLRTMEGDYVSTMVLGSLPTEVDLQGYCAETESEDDVARVQRGSVINQALGKANCASGIGWKFANQGINLLQLAASESASFLRGTSSGNTAFARQLYIHAITYLLRGLPEDLTLEEEVSIRYSLPASVIGHITPPGTDTKSQASSSEPSVIHRVTASSIVQVFVAVQFLLPYLRHILATAITYERQHKLSERMVNQGLDLGKRGIEVSERLVGTGDGKVGEVLGQTARWIVEGVVGGVHEGMGQGIGILDARGKESEQHV